jgi:tripartite ATP-independent transporter DctP family solute receptor
LKKKLSILLVLALVLFAHISVVSAAQFKDEYKLSVVVGPGFPWGAGAEKFVELVEDRTAGKVKIKPYFGGKLFAGKQTNEFAMLQQGQIDMAISSTINWSSQVKELNVFSLPFMYQGYDEIDAIYNGKTGAYILNLLEEKGVKAFGWGENGFREITNSKRPITSPDDLKGLRVRVVGTPIFFDTYNALGARPISMPWGSAINGFKQGVVDGQENPLLGVEIPVEIWNYHSYITLWHYLFDPLVIGINKEVWDSFDSKTQEIIEKSAEEALEYEQMLARMGLDDGTALNYLKENNEEKLFSFEDPIKFIESKGMNVSILSSEQYQAFKDKTQPVRDKWRKIIGEELYQILLEDLEKK